MSIVSTLKRFLSISNFFYFFKRFHFDFRNVLIILFGLKLNLKATKRRFQINLKGNSVNMSQLTLEQQDSIKKYLKVLQ